MNMKKELLATAIKAALDAGRDIMEIYDDPEADFGIERKADNSPLTRADKAAHARIMTYLEPTGIPVLSEEGAHLPYDERRTWQRLWIVDPLDGTKEFIKRNGEFTVNIALVEEGAPVMGVIYVPVKQQLYYGIVGEGATKEEEGVKSSLPLPMGERAFTVVASRSHLSAETADFIDNLRREHPDLELVSSWSSLKICLVAEGKADIYPRHAPTMEWDTAAGDAIARAAGREVVDATTDEPLRYNKDDLHNPWFVVE
jgi:3'(2'), 5'-bisphosphate nucleotidase